MQGTWWLAGGRRRLFISEWWAYCLFEMPEQERNNIMRPQRWHVADRMHMERWGARERRSHCDSEHITVPPWEANGGDVELKLVLGDDLQECHGKIGMTCHTLFRPAHMRGWRQVGRMEEFTSCPCCLLPSSAPHERPSSSVQCSCLGRPIQQEPATATVPPRGEKCALGGGVPRTGGRSRVLEEWVRRCCRE